MNEETKKLLEDIKGEVKSEIIADLKDNAPLRKDIFGSEIAKTDDIEAKSKACEYIKAKFSGDNVKVKALSGNSTNLGEELVPEYFSNEVIRIAGQYGVIRKYARRVPMTLASHKFPTAGSVVAYRIGHGSKATASQPATGSVTLTAEKVIVMIPFENELLKDANINTVDLLIRLSAEALAKKEDIWGLIGEGAGEGIFQTVGVPHYDLATGNDSFADITFDDMLEVMNLVDESALANVKWVMSYSEFNQLRKIKASTTGEYILQPPAGGQPAMIWNIPVVFSTVMPKTSDADQVEKPVLALANFDYLLLGDREAVSVEMSRQATVTDVGGVNGINLFEQDMTAVKVMERIDIKLGEPTKAFAILKTGATS